MKVVLFAAMSLNGMIADRKGNEDFLSDVNWKTFSTLAEKIGCFVVGRKADEVVSKWKDYNFDGIKAAKIVVSKSKGVKSPRDAIKKAKNEGFNSILLAGGGLLNSSFAKQNLIDELIIYVAPVILGRGVRVIFEENYFRRLRLIGSRKLSEGIIQLRYGVMK